jgi:hypothetical protein
MVKSSRGFFFSLVALWFFLCYNKKVFYDNHSEPPETRIEDFEDTEIKFHDMEFSDTDCHLSEPSEQ